MAAGIEKLKDFDIFFDGNSKKGIPAVSWTLKNGITNYSLYDLSDRMRMRGWLVSAYSMPADIQETVVMRVVLRHGFSVDMASMFVEDVKHCLEYFEKHPISVVQTASDVNQFEHSGR